VKHSLLTDQPEPLWRSYKPENIRLLDLLHVWSEQKSVGWITSTTELREVWHWRHTRLRDILVGCVLAQYFREHLHDGANTILSGLLSNPGLAEAWAVAVVFVVNDEIQKQFLTHVSEKQPLLWRMLVWTIRDFLCTVVLYH
jgi:hypothetical protein